MFGTAAIVVIAVEVRGNGSGRLRTEVVGELSADALFGFVEDNVAKGSTVKAEAWQDFRRLATLG
jgi:hypothetical protein